MGATGPRFILQRALPADFAPLRISRLLRASALTNTRSMPPRDTHACGSCAAQWAHGPCAPSTSRCAASASGCLLCYSAGAVRPPWLHFLQFGLMGHVGWSLCCHQCSAVSSILSLLGHLCYLACCLEDAMLLLAASVTLESCGCCVYSCPLHLLSKNHLHHPTPQKYLLNGQIFLFLCGCLFCFWLIIFMSLSMRLSLFGGPRPDLRGNGSSA